MRRKKYTFREREREIAKVIEKVKWAIVKKLKIPKNHKKKEEKKSLKLTGSTDVDHG